MALDITRQEGCPVDAGVLKLRTLGFDARFQATAYERWLAPGLDLPGHGARRGHEPDDPRQ